MGRIHGIVKKLWIWRRERLLDPKLTCYFRWISLWVKKGPDSWGHQPLTIMGSDSVHVTAGQKNWNLWYTQVNNLCSTAYLSNALEVPFNTSRVRLATTSACLDMIPHLQSQRRGYHLSKQCLNFGMGRVYTSFKWEGFDSQKMQGKSYGAMRCHFIDLKTALISVGFFGSRMSRNSRVSEAK